MKKNSNVKGQENYSLDRSAIEFSTELSLIPSNPLITMIILCGSYWHHVPSYIFVQAIPYAVFGCGIWGGIWKRKRKRCEIRWNIKMFYSHFTYLFYFPSQIPPQISQPNTALITKMILYDSNWHHVPSYVFVHIHL